MSPIENFKNAPSEATATHKVTGSRAVKIVDDCWLLSNGFYVDDEEMENYTLDPVTPATAREALDLAWELAYEVKPGQVVPKDARYLEFSSFGLKESTAHRDLRISPELAPIVRTLDPLPDPEPDWADALVVLARHAKEEPDSPPSLWANLGGGMWGHVETTKRATVRDLRDVTPLYPEEGQDA